MKSDSPKGVFRTDPPIQHRFAQQRREQVNIEGSAAGLWRALVYRVACPECGAETSVACSSQSERDHGKPLRGYHYQRMAEARRRFGRKRKKEEA